MSEELDYRIVVPSYDRVSKLKETKEVLPEFTALVNREEEDKYREAFDGDDKVNVVAIEEECNGIAEARDYALRTFDEDYLVMLDDDIEYVTSLVGQETRKLKEPEAIQRVIEGGVMMLKDLDLGVYAWSSYARPTFFSGNDPIDFTSHFLDGEYIIRNDDTFSIDTSLHIGEDTDLEMQARLEGRIIFTDTRLCWVDGEDGGNEGGLQGYRDEEKVQESMERLLDKWGSKYAKIEKTEDGDINSLKFRVDRKSDLANKR